MPAARLTTRFPSATLSLISASRPPLSCGLTTSTRVSASAAASTLSITRTPYFSVSSAARSSRRSVITSSSTGRPARSSPERRVSPMTPAPKIATVPMRPKYAGWAAADRGRFGGGPPARRRGRSAGADERAQEELQVGRALGHPAHQVAVPVLAERHVDAQLVTAVGDPGLLAGADAVQHLELVAVRRAAVVAGEGLRDVDEPRVVAGHHRVPLARHQHLEAAHVRQVDVATVLERHRRGLLVGALAQPHPAARAR